MNTQEQRNLPHGKSRPGKFRKHHAPITEESPFNWTSHRDSNDLDAMKVFGGMMFWRNGHRHFFEPSLHVRLALARENLLRTFLQIPIEEYRA